jgi:hypothetical protein
MLLSSMSRARRRNWKSSKLLSGSKVALVSSGACRAVCLAFEAGVAFALFVDHVGQVVDARLDVAGVHVDRRFGVEIAESDLAVVDLHLVESDRQQLAQLRPPVGAFTSLRVLLVGAAIDEVDLGLKNCTCATTAWSYHSECQLTARSISGALTNGTGTLPSTLTIFRPLIL